ncbi:MAG: tetratricopeptide repeat protein [Armatimonadota bacterium]|nr:tetratricopeptide repeat protein [Armatimonadota bacterium]MDR7548741.1 tetratricopeptide repeat protein [Armatimonadota bacterium]
MGTRQGDGPDARRRRSARTTPSWVLSVQFAGALIVLGFLAAGPGPLEAFARLIQQAPAAQIRAAKRVTPGLAVSAPSAGGPVFKATVPTVGPARRLESTRKVETPSSRPASDRAPPTPAPGTRPRPAPRATPSPAADEPTLTPPKYFERLMREGYQLYSTGWYGPAIGRFRQAAAVMPGSASAQLWMGRAAWKAGRLTEARQALERAIELDPTSAAAREARTLLERLE